MKRIIKLAFLTVILVFVSGCMNSNSIVGTWQYYMDGQVSNNVYYKFNKGDTGSYTYGGSTKNFKYEDRGNKVIITYEGNTASSELDYSISNGILTIKDSFGSDVNYKRK